MRQRSFINAQQTVLFFYQIQRRIAQSVYNKKERLKTMDGIPQTKNIANNKHMVPQYVRGTHGQDLQDSFQH